MSGKQYVTTNKCPPSGSPNVWRGAITIIKKPYNAPAAPVPDLPTTDNKDAVISFSISGPEFFYRISPSIYRLILCNFFFFFVIVFVRYLANKCNNVPVAESCVFTEPIVYKRR